MANTFGCTRRWLCFAMKVLRMRRELGHSRRLCFGKLSQLQCNALLKFSRNLTVKFPH